jgi:hypothetical protein
MPSNNYITRTISEVRKYTELDSNIKYLKTATGNCASGLIQKHPTEAFQLLQTNTYIWKRPKYIFVITEFLKCKSFSFIIRMQDLTHQACATYDP